MRFRYATDNDKQSSCLFGYVTATYEELLACFGLPNDLFSDIGKTACAWDLVFDDGTYATVYSYCEPAPGRLPSIPTGTYQWHIGGRSNHAVDRIVEAIGASRFEYVDPDRFDENEFVDIPF
jgi:hypothetical protein